MKITWRHDRLWAWCRMVSLRPTFSQVAFSVRNASRLASGDSWQTLTNHRKLSCQDAYLVQSKCGQNLSGHGKRKSVSWSVLREVNHRGWSVGGRSYGCWCFSRVNGFPQVSFWSSQRLSHQMADEFRSETSNTKHGVSIWSNTGANEDRSENSPST